MPRTRYTPWSLSVVEDGGPGQKSHPLPGVSFKSPPVHLLSQAAKEQWKQLVSQNSVRTATAPEKRAQLKTLWNSSLPINRLPTDLLVFIFILSTDSGDYDPHFSGLDRRCNIPRVCRYWYDLALSTPTLWRAVDTGKERTRRKYVTHCLNSSATFPLHVYIRASKFCEADLALFLPHVGRVEVLEISILWAPWLMPFLSKLPVLKTLRLRYTNSQGELCLSAERFPCLQSLEITGNSKVPKDPQIYASLHTLHLTRCPSDLSLSEFFDLLSTCSNLKVLSLFNYLGDLVQDHPSTSTASRPRTVLQRLKSLSFGDSSYDVITPFFARFACPPSARVYISCEPGEEYTEDDNPIHTSTKALPSDLLSSLSMISRVQLINLHCMWTDNPDEHYDFTLTGRDAGDLEVAQFRFDFEPELEPPTWINPFNDQVVFMRTAFRGAPLTHLKIAAVDMIELTIEREEWSNVLKTFPALESLHLQGWSVARRLWNALKPAPGEVVPCPRLRSVRLLEAWTCTTVGEIPEARKFFDDMVDALRERAARDTRLRELNLLVEFEYYEDYDELELDRAKHVMLQELYLSTLEMLVENVTYTLRKFPRGFDY